MIKKYEKISIFLIYLILIFSFISLDNKAIIAGDSINYFENAYYIYQKFIAQQSFKYENIVYPLLYPFALFFLIDFNQISDLTNCIEIIDSCKQSFKNIYIFHFTILMIAYLFIYKISKKITKNIILSLLIFFLISINSYYFSRIFIIGPEIFSFFLFVLNFYFLTIFILKNRIKYLTFFLISGLILFFIKPFFLIVLIFYNLILFFKKKIYFNYFVISILCLILVLIVDNNIKKKIYGPKKFGEDKYVLTVLKLRTSYGYINYNEIVPLFISFVPHYGNKVNELLFSKEKVLRMAPGKNGRNYFYNNMDEIINNNKINTNTFGYKDIVLQNFSNLIKQIILTPIFIFRGLFMPAGTSDFFINIEKSFLLNLYLYFNYFFYSIVKMLFAFFYVISILKHRLSKINLIFLYPATLIFLQGVVTHNMPRYNALLVGVSIIFLIYYLSKKDICKK